MGSLSDLLLGKPFSVLDPAVRQPLRKKLRDHVGNRRGACGTHVTHVITKSLMCRLLLLDEPFGVLGSTVRQSLLKGVRDHVGHTRDTRGTLVTNTIQESPVCRLLLLDEPFGALDPAVRQSLRKGLRDIIDRVGITAIFVTHDQVHLSILNMLPTFCFSMPNLARTSLVSILTAVMQSF